MSRFEHSNKYATRTHRTFNLSNRIFDQIIDNYKYLFTSKIRFCIQSFLSKSVIPYLPYSSEKLFNLK